MYRFIRTKLASYTIISVSFQVIVYSNIEITVYRELKQEIGFEEYLEYVKGTPSRLFLKFCSGTHGLFEGLSRHVKGVGHKSVLITGLVRNRLSMFFLSVHHMIPETKFFLLFEDGSSSRCF